MCFVLKCQLEVKDRRKEVLLRVHQRLIVLGNLAAFVMYQLMESGCLLLLACHPKKERGSGLDSLRDDCKCVQTAKGFQQSRYIS